MNLSIPFNFSLKRFHSAIILASGVFLFLLSAQNVFAITLTPPRLELAGDPGEAINSSFKVTNDSNSNVTYYTQVENFEAQDETGSPSFVTTREGLATWVNVDETITIKAGEQKTVPFSINVPRNAEPGGYFASIFVRTTPPPRNGGEVSIGARLGTLLLVRVNGEIQEGVDILEFSTKSKQRFYSSLPVEMYYRFQNTGSDRVKPEGDIVIKNILGMNAKILSANRTDGSVLPRSIRKFETFWINGGGGKEELTAELSSQKIDGFFGQAKSQLSNFAFGIYSANLDIRFGESGHTANSKFWFIVFPWQLTLIVLLGLLVIFIIGRFLLRWYSKRVIRQHQQKL